MSSLPHRTFSSPHTWRRKVVEFQLTHRDPFWNKEQLEMRLQSRPSLLCSLNTSLTVVTRDSLREGGFTMLTTHECLRSTLEYERTCLLCGSSQEAEGEGCWCPVPFSKSPVCGMVLPTSSQVFLPQCGGWHENGPHGSEV